MRRFLLVVAALAATVPALAAAQVARPDLTSYRVIDPNTVTDQDVFRFGPNEDVRFIGPETPRTERLRIEGGRNIAVTGSNFAPQYQWTTGGENATGTIQTVRTNGSIYIEDVHLDNAGAFGSDGITLNSAGTTKIPATIVNSTVVNVSGAQQNNLNPNDRAHGDIIQPQGVISDHTVVYLNGSKDDQGLFLMKQDNVAWRGKVDNVYLENVNLWLTRANTNCACLLALGGTWQQNVTLRNVTLTRQPCARPCAGESVNVFDNARIDGSVTYVDAAGPVDYAETPTPAPVPVPAPPGDLAGEPGTAPTDPGTPPAPGVVPPVPAPDPATVPVPPGQPPSPALPPAFQPTVPPVVNPPPALPPAQPVPVPPGPAGVLTGISNSVVLSQVMPLPPSVLNEIVETFASQAALWESTLETIALRLFYYLALFELCWVFLWSLAHGGNSIQEWLGLIARQIVVIGFFYWLLLNSADHVLDIVGSFGIAANEASVAGGGMTNLSPTDIFASGINMAKIIWDGITISNPGLSLLLVIAGIVSTVVYALIAAKLIEVLIESAIVAYAGIILMGFGGSSFTREYAISQIRYAISVGVKRFVLQLIIGLSQGIITGWATKVAASGGLNWPTIAILIGAPIVMWRLADTLPQRSQDLITGVATHAPGHLGNTVARAVTAAAGAIVTGAGAMMAAGAAYQAAQGQINQQSQQTGQSPGAAKRAAITARLMAQNLGSAAKAQAGARMLGQNRFGTTGAHMAQDLKSRAASSSNQSNQGGQQ